MNITDDILVSYILNELPAEQHGAVQAWIAASRENKDHFDELRLIWKESKKLGMQSTANVEEAWGRFRQAVGTPEPKTRPFVTWKLARVAAAALLIAGGAYLSWTATHDRSTNKQPVVAAPKSSVPPVVERVKKEAPIVAAHEPIVQEPARVVTGRASVKPKPFLIATRSALPVDNHRTKEFVCNATPCPLEICIVQAVRCDNGTLKKIATCNVLQPDQAGQLHYKAFDRAAGNCDATVAEIRIKRLSTGETIVLNKETQPSTVEEIFDYLTGVKKEQVDILAGVFETDCDNSCNQHKLKIGSDPSHLILQ